MTGVRRRALAAAALLAVAGLTGCDGDGEAPAADPTPTPSADLFTCDRTFTRAAEPPADLREQGGISEWAGGYVGDGYVVRRTASSPLGLVALVEGDLARARAELLPRGIAIMERWHDPQGDVDPLAQVSEVVEARLRPVLAEVRRRVRGLDGVYDVLPWPSGGAVVVEWREPVPAEVAALAGEQADRVRVVVQGVPHSRDEVDRAVAAVEGADGLGAEVTSVAGCADGAGLVVGVADLGERRADLQDELAEVAGMPVLVVPREAAATPAGRPVG